MTSVLLFVYGSLVSADSAGRTLGRPPATRDSPLPATLLGYQREWNVGSSHESHPERTLLEPDGRPFTGTLAVLGLRLAAEAITNGALYRLGTADLELLAVRERNYELRDVTGAVQGADARVFTYVPRPRAVARLARARSAATAVVSHGYAVSVRRAFEALGPGQLEAFCELTEPAGLPERAITTGRDG